MRHILFLCLLMIWLPVSAQDRIEQAIDTSEQTTRESARSQARIDQLDDETRRKLEAYRQAIWERQQLEVYSEQLEELQRIQVQDVTRLREELAEVPLSEDDLMPLMLRMVNALQRFVEADLPFLQDDS